MGGAEGGSAGGVSAGRALSVVGVAFVGGRVRLG